MNELKEKIEKLRKKLCSYEIGMNKNERICLGTAEDLNELHRLERQMFILEFKQKANTYYQKTNMKNQTKINPVLVFKKPMKIINSLKDLDTKKIVFYNKDNKNKDGLLGAFAFALHPDWEDASFFPIDQDMDISKDMDLLIGKDVAVVSFSFNIDITKLIIYHCSSFLSFNHQDDTNVELASINEERHSFTNILTRWFIKDFKSINIVLDKKHSGSLLSWKHLHNRIPKIVRIVSEYILSENPAHYDNLMVAGLVTLEKRLNCIWVNILNDNEERLGYINIAGAHYLEYQQYLLNQMVEDWKDNKTYLKLTNSFGKTYFVPCINSSIYQNELAQSLGIIPRPQPENENCHEYQSTFVTIYHVVGDMVSLTLKRTSVNTSDRTDCLDLLKQFRGTGNSDTATVSLRITVFNNLIVKGYTNQWFKNYIDLAVGVLFDYQPDDSNGLTDGRKCFNCKPPKARGETRSVLHYDESPFNPPDGFRYDEGDFLGDWDTKRVNEKLDPLSR